MRSFPLLLASSPFSAREYQATNLGRHIVWHLPDGSQGGAANRRMSNRFISQTPLVKTLEDTILCDIWQTEGRASLDLGLSRDGDGHPVWTGDASLRHDAKIHANHGTMTVEFLRRTPPTRWPASSSLPRRFLRGLKFHRVIPGFVAQGGCPRGIGSGGPGYTIDCELDGDNQFHDKGVLSIAHAGRNTGGSSSSSSTAMRTPPSTATTPALARSRRASTRRENQQGDTFRVGDWGLSPPFLRRAYLSSHRMSNRGSLRAALVHAIRFAWNRSANQSRFSRKPSL